MLDFRARSNARKKEEVGAKASEMNILDLGTLEIDANAVKVAQKASFWLVDKEGRSKLRNGS